MKNISRTILVVVIALVVIAVGWVLAARQSGSQSQPPPPAEDPQSAAEQALETFRQIVTPENYQALGFKSPDEVNNARLGQPLNVLRVPLDTLQSYSPDQNPEELLVDVNRVIYPVTVDEQVRSSIAVEGIDKQWSATDFGSPKLITSLTQFQEQPSDFIVQVPAFSLYFIASRSDNGLLLTPVVDDARFGFKKGEKLSASAVFERIVPFIDDYNGLPDG